MEAPRARGQQATTSTFSLPFFILVPFFYISTFFRIQAKRGNVKYHLQNVTQNDLYNTVFSPLSDDDSSAKYLVGLAIEYIRCLDLFRIPVEVRAWSGSAAFAVAAAKRKRE